MKPNTISNKKEAPQTKAIPHPSSAQTTAAWKQRNEFIAKTSGQLVYERELVSGTITWWGNVKKMLGYHPSEMAGGIQQWLKLIHPQDRKSVLHLLNTARKNHIPLEANYRCKRKDGRYIEVLDWGLFMPSPKGSPERMTGMMLNITEHDRTEMALQESEEHYRSLFESVPVGLYRSTPSGQILDFNLTGAKMFGYEKVEDIIGQNAINLWVNPKDRNRINQAASREGVYEFENQMKKRDGTIIWVRDLGQAIRDKNGKVFCYEGGLEDITERKQAEEALQKSEARYRAVVHSALDAIISADCEGSIVGWNPGAENIFGYTEDEVRGQPLTLLMPAHFQEGHLAGMKHIQIGREKHHIGKTVELEGLRKDGREFPLELSLSEWQAGDERFYTAIIRDITERRQAEEKIKEKEVRYRGLFEDSPISLWEEDFSAVKLRLEALRKRGVKDFRTYLESHPQVVAECAKLVQVVDLNKAALELYQAENKEELFKNMTTSFCEDSYGSFREELVKIAEGKTQFKMEGVNRTLKGRRLDINLSWSAAPGHQSDLSKVIVSIVDVTERKQAEERSRESEERYRSLVELSPDAIFIHNASVIRYANPAGLKLMGVTGPEQALGKPVLDFVHPDYKEEVKERMRVSAEERKAVPLIEEKFIRLDGSSVDVEVVTTPFTLRGEPSTQVIVHDISERKKMMEELHASEERLRSIIENSQSGIFTIDQNFKFTYANGELCRMLGTPLENVIGQDFQTFLDDADRTFVVDRYLRRQRGEEVPARYEFDIRRKSGEKRRVEISSSIVTDPLGNVQTIGQLLDITERKRAEDNLLQQLAFDELLTNISTGFASCLGSEIDEQIQASLADIGVFFGVENAFIVLAALDLGTWSMPYRWLAGDRQEAAKDFTGVSTEIFPWSKKMLLDGKVIKIDTLDDLPSAAAAERKLYKHQGMKSALEVPFHGLGGLVNGCIGLGSYSHRMQWSPDDVRRLGIVSETIANIFDRKRAEDESRRRTEELEVLTKLSAAMRVAQSRSEIIHTILEQLSKLLTAEGAVIFMKDDATGEIVFEQGYREWEHWTGMRLVPGEGISGKVISTDQPYRNNNAAEDPSSIDPKLFGDLTCAACVPLIANELTIGGLWIGRRTPISNQDMRLLTAIGDMAANAIHRQALTEDLKVQLQTLQQTQDRLLQSQKLAAIGELVSGVAHELNNPLTSVVLYSQLVQQEKLSESANINLSKVTSEALRAGRIVRGLLDFSRQRPIQREIIQINDVVKNSVDLLAYELNSHNIKLETELSLNLPLVMADPHQLQQVFVNLIQNAWQAMSAAHGEGYLAIYTETGPSQYSAMSPEKSKMVRICFRDDGPGIPDDVKDRIFDPFFTTKPEGSGTGLGLSICHGIIAEHGGHIWVESAPGQGAKFVVELAVSSIDEIVAAKPVDRQTLASPAKDLRILVVDDEPNIQSVLAQSLQRRGYIVDIASNGLDGLAHLSRASYDLILCDIRMPGINGVDFYRQVQAKDKNIAKKIIFITGDTANKTTRDFIEENQVKCLRKPFELADLLQVVQLAGEN